MGGGRQAAVEEFRRVVAEARSDLFTSALAIAAPEYPALDESSYRGRLEGWAEAARSRAVELAGHRATPALLAAVSHVLFREVGLRGNMEDYQDPRNSFLNEVMDRQLGLPITLSLLFVEVARRVGLQAHGVAFPGHFLARVDDPDDDGTFVVVDSFSGGNVLGLENLAQLMADAGGSARQLSPQVLSPAGTNAILLRMLRNLKASYAARRDMERALLAQERILVLAPDEPAEARDHGLLLSQAGEPDAAVRALRDYLQRSPDAPDADQVRAAMDRAQKRAYDVQ